MRNVQVFLCVQIFLMFPNLPVSKFSYVSKIPVSKVLPISPNFPLCSSFTMCPSFLMCPNFPNVSESSCVQIFLCVQDSCVQGVAYVSKCPMFPSFLKIKFSCVQVFLLVQIFLCVLVFRCVQVLQHV